MQMMGGTRFFGVAKKKKKKRKKKKKKRTGTPLIVLMRNLKNERGWRIFGPNPVTYNSNMRNGMQMRIIQLGQYVYAPADI